jgi:hypothetical protein
VPRSCICARQPRDHTPIAWAPRSAEQPAAAVRALANHQPADLELVDRDPAIAPVATIASAVAIRANAICAPARCVPTSARASQGISARRTSYDPALPRRGSA